MICPMCGKNEVPPRCRKCPDCLVVGPATPPSTEASNRQVVLSCGCVVTTDRSVGEGALCAEHRQVRTVARPYSGEPPIPEPPPADSARWLDPEFFARMLERSRR